ncbi:hypothetical protein OH77DRAFT_263486 [Trametes cingulata]|nr:hypothetical protein OH77DRAFT_263486 [Trametes cingulata]
MEPTIKRPLPLSLVLFRVLQLPAAEDTGRVAAVGVPAVEVGAIDKISSEFKPQIPPYTQTGRMFREKYHPRAPASGDEAVNFVAGFQKFGLSFIMDIMAYPGDIMADFIGDFLGKHMVDQGLELRPVEGVETTATGSSLTPTPTFSTYWQYLATKSVGRASAVDYGGPVLHRVVQPHTSQVTVSSLKKQASRIPSFPPGQLNGKILIVIAPVRHVVVGPLPNERAYISPQRPSGYLHLCLGLRAWPAKQVGDGEPGTITCMPGCERAPEAQSPLPAAVTVAPSQPVQVPVPRHIHRSHRFRTPPPSPVDSASSITALPSTSQNPVMPRQGADQPPNRQPHREEVPRDPATRRIGPGPGSLSTDGHGGSLASTLEYMELSITAAKDWQACLRQFQPNYERGVMINAPSVLEGAQALFEAVTQFASAGTGTVNLLLDRAEVLDLNEASLLARFPSVQIGDAVGPGPARAVFAQTIQLMVKNSRYWTRTSDDQYYTPLIPGTPLSRADLDYYRACGVVLSMALLWGQDILPISPMLLALLVGGYEAACDKKLLTCLSPKLVARLDTWPPPRIQNDVTGSQEYQVQLGRDPMNLVMEFVPNTQASHIRHLSVEGVDALTPTLTSGLLFQAKSEDLGHPGGELHTIYRVMKEGLDQQGLTRSHIGRLETSSILETFQEKQISRIVTGLCANHRVTSYAQLIPLLKPQVIVLPEHPGFDASLDYDALAGRWMQAFQRYLSGTGHPDHERFQEARLENAPETHHDTFRPLLFLEAVSDSELLPRDEDTIEIRFMTFLSSGIGRQAQAQQDVDVWFHTCSLAMDVVIHRPIVNILAQDIPDNLAVVTDFDVYIHTLRTADAFT